MSGPRTTKNPLGDLPHIEQHRTPRPKRIRYFTVKPQGPKIYQLGKNPEVDSDWFSPPAAFLDPRLHGSSDEWRYYKGLMLLLDPGRDPRQPPYLGGKHWAYQKAVGPAGFGQEGRVPGGQVVDFVVDQGRRILGFRIQTERYHVMAGPDKQAFDFYLKTHSVGIDLMIDLYTQYSEADKSGRATMAQLRRALRGEQEPNPGPFGTARQVRTPR